MDIRIIKVGVFLLSLTLLAGCGGKDKKQKKEEEEQKPPVQKTVKVPGFNADSAYYYVKKQVNFGPRVPGTQAHAQCADWLSTRLNSFADSVIVQDFRASIFNGQLKAGKNIIGIFQPEKKKRILVCAHWDSRPFADQEEDPSLHNNPIDGANDGASGVGVLMEIARKLSKQDTHVGIDIIFFDLEDYGEPQGQQSRKENSWALGSQYWSQNPHTFNYSAIYGILLDMVGVENAQFPREGTSEYFASDILDKVWNQAAQLGYEKYFVNQSVSGIIDDHLYVNQIQGIPTIDIIALDRKGKSDFFKHWHTLQDNMENIDKTTLNIVGNTVMHVIYKED